MNKAFQNFTWENSPSTNTPLSANNLNKINNGLNEVDNRVVTMDTSKANASDIGNATITLKKSDGTVIDTFTTNASSNKDITFPQMGVNVEANPTVVGTETALTSIKIGSTDYKVEGGGDDVSFDTDDSILVTNGTNTPIEANPTLVGTETALTGLKVGDTKYSVGGGGGSTLYKHFVSVKKKNAISSSYSNLSIVATIVTQSATPFTESTLTQWLLSNSFDGQYIGGFYPSCGCNSYTDSQRNIHIPVGIRATEYPDSGASQIEFIVNVYDYITIQTSSSPTYSEVYTESVPSAQFYFSDKVIQIS